MPSVMEELDLGEREFHEIYSEILGDKYITDETPNSDGWVTCWALNRDKGDSPNAAFSITTGRYNDRGGKSDLDKPMSLIDVMVQHGGCMNERHAITELKRRFRPHLLTGFQKPDPRPESQNAPFRFVEEYPYHDANGSLVYSVERHDNGLPGEGRKKKFLQKRPNPNGTGWLFNLQGVTPTLYRLPQLLAAPKTGLVFIPEGEKDVNSLVRIGLVATCNSGGAVASAWRPEFSQYFTGRQVVVLPDNESPDKPGPAHGERIASSLSGVAAVVKSIVFPGFKDVSDWLAAGHAKGELLSIVASSPAWTPKVVVEGKKPVSPTKVSLVQRSTMKLVRLSDIEEKSVQWLWTSVIAFGKITIVAGDPGQSKSLCSVDIAARFTRGNPWPDGSHCEQRGTVIFMNAEDDPEDTLKPRFMAAGGDPDRAFFMEAIVIESVKESEKTERQFNLQADIQQLEEALEAIDGPVLIVIDPVSNYMGKSDTHKDSEVRGALMPLVRLIQKTGAACMLVAHLNKSSASGAMYRVGGSIGFVGVARLVWTVSRDPEDRESTRRLFLPLKANISAGVTGFSYEIRSNFHDVPYLSWEADACTVTVAEAMAPPVPAHGGKGPGRPSRAEEAKGWLRDLLSDGPVPSSDVAKSGESMGYSERTISRARNDLGVRARKSSEGAWELVLPQGCQNSDTPF